MTIICSPVTVPENNSTKNIIISILSNDWPLETKKIFTTIRKEFGKNISYQGVHKTLNELLIEKILIKQQKCFSINTDWLNKVEEFASKVKSNYQTNSKLFFEGVREFKQEGDTQTIVFNSYADAELYRKTLQTQYFSSKEKKFSYVTQTAHLKSPLIYSEKSLTGIREVSAMGINCYLLVNGNSVIDDYCANYYANKFINVKLGANCAKKCDTMVLGDIVTQTYLPQELRTKINKIYEQTKSIEKIRIPKFYKEIYENQTPIKFIVMKNQEIAEQIRQQTKNQFSK